LWDGRSLLRRLLRLGNSRERSELRRYRLSRLEVEQLCLDLLGELCLQVRRHGRQTRDDRCERLRLRLSLGLSLSLSMGLV
jgi:hypothetical protein